MAKFVFKAKKSPKKPVCEARETFRDRRASLQKAIANFNEDEFKKMLDDMDDRNQKLSDAIQNLEKQLGLPVGGEDEFEEEDLLGQ